MPEPVSVGELIGLIYESIADGDAWTRFLEKLRDALGGNQAALFVQGLDGRPSHMLSLGDPERDRAYSAHYGAVNPWFTRGAHLVKPGAVVTSEWFAPEDLRRTEFYARWLRPQSMFYAVNGFIFDRPGYAGNVAVAKSWSEGGFSSEDLALVRGLLPHLQRALALQRRLLLPEKPSGAFACLLESVPYAVLLTDEKGRVTFANAQAELLLARRDGLARGPGGELRAESGPETAALRRLLRAAAGTGVDEAGSNGGFLSLTALDGVGRLGLLVSPIRMPELTLAGRTVGAIVLIADQQTRSAPAAGDLRCLYGLTAREAELAVHLVGGKPLREAAACMGIGREAARTHLSRILQKTNTHRQAELVRLLLTSFPCRTPHPNG